MIPFTRQRVLLSCIQHSPHAPRRLYNETKNAVEINWLKNCLYTFKVSASSPPFISDRDKKAKLARHPIKGVFSLCSSMRHSDRGEGLRCSPTSKKKKMGGGGGGLGWVGGVDAGNYHKTNNERLCRKVFEERP